MSDVEPLSGAYCKWHDVYLCDECGLSDSIKRYSDLSAKCERMFYVHLKEFKVVLQAFPGGRRILWPELNRYLLRAHRDLSFVTSLVETKQ